MSAEWEQYEDRFTQRPETYKAYVEIGPSTSRGARRWVRAKTTA